MLIGCQDLSSRGAAWRTRRVQSADWPVGSVGWGHPARPPPSRAAIGCPCARPRGGGHVPPAPGRGGWERGTMEGGAAGGDWLGGARARGSSGRVRGAAHARGRRGRRRWRRGADGGGGGAALRERSRPARHGQRGQPGGRRRRRAAAARRRRRCRRGPAAARRLQAAFSTGRRRTAPGQRARARAQVRAQGAVGAAAGAGAGGLRGGGAGRAGCCCVGRGGPGTTGGCRVLGGRQELQVCGVRAGKRGQAGSGRVCKGCELWGTTVRQCGVRADTGGRWRHSRHVTAGGAVPGQGAAQKHQWVLGEGRGVV